MTDEGEGGYWPPPEHGPARDLVGYGAEPPVVSWPNGARLAVSFCLNVEEGSERSFAFGDAANEPNPDYPKPFPADVRDLTTESLFEYGSRVGVHRVLELFEDLGVTCTAFACAVALAANPSVGRRLVDAGHEVCSHGLRWTEPWTLGREAERDAIHDAVRLFEDTVGVRPRGWYSRYGPSIHTRELLHAEGFAYDSDAYNDDLPYYVEVAGDHHLVVPYTMLYNDAQMAGRVGGEEWLASLVRGFDQLLAESATTPKLLSIGLHPRFSGQAARASLLREFIEHAQSTGQAWFARRDEIADVFTAQHPPPGPRTPTT